MSKIDKDHLEANGMLDQLDLIHSNRMVRVLYKQLLVLEKKRLKGWDKIYVGVDIHETVHHPTWSTQMSEQYYADAKETLQLMSEDPEICMILWSCSLPELNKRYAEVFREEGINFDYINSNPEVTSTEYADFETKLYFNVGLDDKFGFIPEEDWPMLRKFMENRKWNRLHPDTSSSAATP